LNSAIYEITQILTTVQPDAIRGRKDALCMLDNQSKNMDKEKMRFACWTTRARIWIKTRCALHAGQPEQEYG